MNYIDLINAIKNTAIREAVDTNRDCIVLYHETKGLEFCCHESYSKYKDGYLRDFRPIMIFDERGDEVKMYDSESDFNLLMDADREVE